MTSPRDEYIHYKTLYLRVAGGSDNTSMLTEIARQVRHFEQQRPAYSIFTNTPTKREREALQRYCPNLLLKKNETCLS